ncbi:TolC family protein [Methylocystis sp. ATCC 49242]|jgi:cobalt-zinc-cadmium efflux system outer membrane protein|uniref:TolC family protein n=1 Tax=Methylocystis sp. ATCC 49242 TaxID=622637 RepID=UPI0001F8740D|nr:TolC family protein [Methylocystis sp. ATCC 49242]
MKRLCRLAFLAVTAVVAGLTVWPVSAGEREMPGATVESVVALARRLSPELAASVLDADAAAHRVGAAGVQPDPTVTLQAWDVNSRGVGQRWIGVEQQFRLWGKTDLEKGIAQADADVARRQSEAIEVDLVARVKTAYALYGAAQRAVDLSKSLKQRVDDLLALLRLRYGASSVDQQEVIKAEIEAANAAADVARREGDAKLAAARLNALIGRAALAPLASPKGFRPLKTKLTLAGVQDLARSSNPQLAATHAQVRAATGAKELTDLNYYPDITAGATFVQRPTGENSGQFLLGFKVPLQYEAKDAEQRAASASLGAAQARNEALRIRLDGDVAEAWFRLEAIRKAIKIFEQRQLPPARLSVETASKGFDAGTTDLATLLESERRLRAIELELLAYKVEEQSKYADLERLAGGSL